MTTKILLVDDDPGMIELVAEHIEKCFSGIELITATSGYNAIKILQNNRNFEIIISDYNMPDGTGADVLKYIAQTKHPIFIVLHTSDLNPILPEQLGDFFLGIVQKMNFDELNRILVKLLIQ
jgi:CheY-like chemotaxis protein